MLVLFDVLAFVCKLASAPHRRFALCLAHIEKKDDKTVIFLSAMLEKAGAAGYTICKKVEFEHGHYEANAINAQGKPVKIQIDAKTGDVSVLANKTVNLSLLEAVRIAEKEGYHDISEIKMKEGHYKIEARNKDNKKVELKINANTGAIKVERDWF